MRQLPLCALLVLATCPVSAQKTARQPEVVLRQAQQAFDEGRYRDTAEQLALFRELSQVKVNPLLAVGALALEGSLHLASGDLAAAQKLAVAHAAELKRHETHFDRNTFAVQRQNSEVFLGELSARQKDHSAAVRHYRQALAIPAGERSRDLLWEPRTKLELCELEEPAQAERLLRETRDALESDLRRWRNERKQEDRRAEAALLLAEMNDRLKELPAAIATVSAALADRAGGASDRIDLYLKLADYQRRTKDLDSALQALQQAEQLLTPADATAKPAEIHSARAVIYAARGQRSLAEASWQQAVDRYQKLLAATPPTSGKGTSPGGAGNRIENRQKLVAALRNLEAWQPGIDAARELLADRQQTLLPGDGNVERAEAALASLHALAALDVRASHLLANTAQGPSRAEQVRIAQQALQEMLDTWNKKPGQFELEQFRVLSNLVELARFRGEFSDARKHIDNGRSLLKSLERNEKLTALEQAVFHLNAGSVLAALGKYNDAEQDYGRALQHLSSGEHGLPWKALEIESLIHLNRAMLQRSQGQLDQAQELAKEALELWNRTGSTRTELRVPYYLAAGNIELARYEKLESLTNPLERRKSRDVKQAALAEATRCAELAQKIMATHSLQANPVAIHVNHLHAQTLLHQHLQDARSGDTESTRQRLHDARDSCQKMYDHAADLKLKVEMARSRSIQLEVATRQGDWEQAATLSKQAADLAGELQAFPNLRCQVLLQRAQVLFRLARQDQHFDRDLLLQAIPLLEEASTVVELPRAATTGADRERAEFYAHFAPIFDMLVDAYIATGDTTRALQATEWRRNRTLRDQMRVTQSEGTSATHPDPQLQALRQEEFRLLDKLREEFAKARALLMASETLQETNPEQIAKANAAVDEIRGDLIQHRRRIHKRDPFVRSILEQGTAQEYHRTAASAIQTLLPTSDPASRTQAVLIYHIGARWSHLFLLTGSGKGLDCHPLTVTENDAKTLGIPKGPLSATLARDMVRRLIDAAFASAKSVDLQSPGPSAAGPPGRGHYSPDQWLAASRTILPPEAVASLRRFQRVVVVPDGPLHELPLEMLQTAPTKYVIDELPPMSYAPSALILQAIQDRKPVVAAKLLLTVAPSYKLRSPAAEESELRKKFGQWKELTFARGESEAIRTLFAGIASDPTGVKALPQPGEEATEAAVRQRLEGVRFLHFAAHGRVEESFDNLFGGLALSASETAVADDGILSLYDIERLNLDGCELAILSACSTNRGVERPLEAGSTLARAFLASGVGRVVCSHWDVDDASTSELMRQFAQRITDDLRQGRVVNYATALHEARLHVRKDLRWKEPYYWAPFVLIGPALGPSSIPLTPAIRSTATARP